VSKTPAPAPVYTYDTAPDSPQLAGKLVTARTLKHAVATGKISYAKFGNRVIFTEADLQEYVDRSTVKAVR